MNIFETIKIPVLGSVTTGVNVALSLTAITEMAQCIAAIMAILVAILTMILTIKKIKALK